VRLKIIELTEADQGTDWASTRRLGWIFNSLRLPKEIDTSTKKNTRLREVSKELALHLLFSYGLLSPTTSETSEDEQLNACNACPPKDNPPSDTNGSDFRTASPEPERDNAEVFE
jgi:hypothetical protein